MLRFSGNWFCSNVCRRFALALLAVTTVLAAWASGGQNGQFDNGPSSVCEGSLLYRSPISGLYESVPLVHTDVTLDVRGLAAAATVTQQYVNSGTEPIEAVYVFPLPHDAAVYDMEIRIGNRLIRSVIREREEAKRVYESAKSEGKRAALVEEERPNIFTASVANIMPGDQMDGFACGFRWWWDRATFPARRPWGTMELDGRWTLTLSLTLREFLPSSTTETAVPDTTFPCPSISMPASSSER